MSAEPEKECPLGCHLHGGHEIYRLPHFMLTMDGQPRSPIEPVPEPDPPEGEP